MNNSLDISIHGPQRVKIVEQLVHICRYSPGLVLLEGDAGKSPVNFLRDMANLLRDELDFALLDDSRRDVRSITAELVSRWYIYQVVEHEQTDIQSVHHYLDLGLQSGRLALIVIERASALSEEAINFLVGMMARHSQLTVLFAGIVDARPLLRRSQQEEVPVSRIDIPDSANHPGVVQAEKSQNIPTLSASNFDHAFSDESYDLPENDLWEDDLYESGLSVNPSTGRREPVIGGQYEVTQSSVRFNASDSRLGVSTRLSAVHEWGVATLAGIREKKSAGSLLLLGCLVFVALMLSLVLYPKDTKVASAELSLPPSALVVEPLLPVSSVPSPVTDLSPKDNGGVAATTTAEPLIVPTEVQPPPAPVSVVKPALPENSLSAPLPVAIPEQQARGIKLSKTKTSGAIAKAVPATEKQWRSTPANFTVQIAAAHGEVNIRKLEAKLPTVQPHFLYRTTRNGQPWFVLVYGSFTSKSAAVSARDSLGGDIKKNTTPWVRKQGEVFAR